MALARLFAAIDRLSEVAGQVVAVLVPAMALVICYEVVARYAFNAPTIWAHNLSTFMFGYLGLLAGAYVQSKGRHIRVDLLYGRLSPRAQAGLDLVSYLLAFLFLSLIATYGWHKAMDDFRIGARLSSEWAPPRGHFTLMIPLGATLLILQSLADWLRSLHIALTGRSLE